jgi:aryl-alcohol dehydrogenase-like predicted oxidoreductase
MAAFEGRIVLGRSGLRTSRLGLGSSYGAPTSSYLEAFERGVNYFYWGTHRRDAMADAVRQLAPRAREELVVVVQSYARAGFLVTLSVERALRRLGLEYADVLLLGWHNWMPPKGVLGAARELCARGRVRKLAISSHSRAFFPRLLEEPAPFEIWHVRYNAVHRGAEREVFPSLQRLPHAERPGVVTYTTTRWGHLCDAARTPPGERTPNGTDCYRFALSHPDVNMVLAGPSNPEHMRQALRALELGPMSEEELAWMRRVGDHIYGRDVTTAVRDAV